MHEPSQFISPNGDGKNDCWEILELKIYPKNVVKLFNRWGNLVYEKKGYVDHFCGEGNIKSDSESNQKSPNILPEGTYYYIIDLGDTAIEPYVGYMQIKR